MKQSADKVQGIIDLIVVITQTIAPIVSIFPAQKELKRNFDKNGDRRNLQR